MRYIWNMGLSGSVLIIGYLCGKRLLSDRLDLRWRCLALRCVLLYYLLPLTFLKRFYEEALRIGLGRPGRWERVTFVDSSRSLLVYGNGGWHFNAAFRWELILGGIWIVVGAGAFLLMFARYLRGKRNLDSCGGVACAQTEIHAYEAIRRREGIRRQVRYLDSTPADREGRLAFTVGVRRPVILYPAGRSERERELIIEHELIHIRHGDLPWQMLASAACILHCVNPLVWYLKGELEQAAELYCDQAVLRDKDAEIKLAYGELLLGMAEGGAGKSWSMALSRKSRRLKERLEAIVERKRYLGRRTSAVIVILSVLLNSLTVLAYQDVQVWIEGDFLENGLLEPGREAEFAPLDLLEDSRYDRDDLLEMEILYDRQFTDGEGNPDPVSEAAGEDRGYGACNHQYVEGRTSDHKRNDSGGCTLTIYRAKRCILCGNVVKEEILDVITRLRCPH